MYAYLGLLDHLFQPQTISFLVLLVGEVGKPALSVVGDGDIYRHIAIAPWH